MSEFSIGFDCRGGYFLLEHGRSLALQPLYRPPYKAKTVQEIGNVIDQAEGRATVREPQGTVVPSFRISEGARPTRRGWRVQDAAVPRLAWTRRAFRCWWPAALAVTAAGHTAPLKRPACPRTSTKNTLWTILQKSYTPPGTATALPPNFPGAAGRFLYLIGRLRALSMVLKVL